MDEAQTIEALAPPLVTVPEDKRPVFAIFEGGGARGVAHVGALESLEENNLSPIGVAGTSAGALVALLVALGYEASEIIDAEDPLSNILTAFGQTPTGLLDESRWRRFRKILGWRAKLAGGGVAVGGVALGSLLAPRTMGAIWSAIDRLGHFSTANIRQFIAAVIEDRLRYIASAEGVGRVVPDKVTFADLASGWPTVIPLKIVATDVENGELVIFDAVDPATRNVVVAEAVAASIAIPLVFEPAMIPSYRPGRFADGGLVSNLPIWTIAGEKLAYEREHPDDRPVPVIGFALAPPPDKGKTGGVLSSLGTYLGKLVFAALQGSQGASTRFLDDVVIARLDCDLKTLSFDATPAAFKAARASGRACADRQLAMALRTRPEKIREELETIGDAALECANALRAQNGDPPVERLRVNLIRPHNAQSLRVVDSLSSSADPDDRLLLDRRGAGAALAFRERQIEIIDFKQAALSYVYMTKYERALVRRDLSCAICVPIFADTRMWSRDPAARDEPAGILVVDSDDDLVQVFQEDHMQDMLTERSAPLYAAISQEVDDGEGR